MQWGIKAKEKGLKGEVGGFAWHIVLLHLSPFSLFPFSPLPPTTGRISPLSDELAFTVETWNQFVRKVLMTNLHRRNFNFFIRKSSQIYCSVQTNPYLLAAQLHTHVSVPYWSPDVWLGLELLRDIQFGLPAILNNSLASYRSVATIITCALTCRKWAWQPQNLRVRFVHPKLNPPS